MSVRRHLELVNDPLGELKKIVDSFSFDGRIDPKYLSEIKTILSNLTFDRELNETFRKDIDIYSIIANKLGGDCSEDSRKEYKRIAYFVYLGAFSRVSEETLLQFKEHFPNIYEHGLLAYRNLAHLYN